MTLVGFDASAGTFDASDESEVTFGGGDVFGMVATGSEGSRTTSIVLVESK